MPQLPDDEVAALHLAVCRRFGEAVWSADGRWDRRTPCDEWDARAVLEHVIGFHDVLVLRPLGLKPERPRADARARWQLTYDSLVEAFESGGVTALDAFKLIPNLTRDVLVHTWDLARAVEADDRLDAAWCQLFYADLPADPQVLSSSEMFSAPVAVPSESDAQAKLLARLGRDPSWRPEIS
ncbi:maleylpyruvate isomerase family mycothiol-dependent enzyme [Mycobacterium sp. SMC-2]|uniref:maleylpyruvate isomerase family mycothiol-dependent enzyme n=1 Tax=Mycobacterium sp. SMC-2 TaxID=2857058 RepID=UPI0021B417BA|nr:maleylpyruvate isomerase family mycothiol-dependent enzyme [Mycobacterium sp. SMC-2]UXA05448.1 maleylpyruvate isomerase family mycothiol-dependent enzyme [Mycobacterium sp. SMC-2]